MKRIKVFLLVLIVSLIGIEGLTAQEEGSFGIYVNPSVYAIAGSEDYIRGIAFALDIRVDLFGILTPGVQAIIEYDGYFNTASVPLLFTLGWEDFYVAVGQTVNLTDISFNNLPWKYSDFPNTFGLGGHFELLPFSDKSALKLSTEFTYTLGGAASTVDSTVDQFNNIVGILAGIKWYVGLTLQLGL